MTSRAMHRLSTRVLADYLTDDPIAEWIGIHRHAIDDDLSCQRWLDATPAKRYAANVLYGDLLGQEGLRVLDVGGGLTSLTRALAGRHAYTLVDLMAHDNPSTVDAFFAKAPPFTLVKADWFSKIESGPFDVVIAADLFPNVDQRLALFLERTLPLAGEVRLSLTYYNESRFYLTRRIDADEVLCLLAWDGEQTSRVLARFSDRIDRPNFSVFSQVGDSVYPNNWQVSLLRLFGSAGS